MSSGVLRLTGTHSFLRCAAEWCGGVAAGRKRINEKDGRQNFRHGPKETPSQMLLSRWAGPRPEGCSMKSVLAVLDGATLSVYPTPKAKY